MADRTDRDDRDDIVWYHLWNIWILFGHGDTSPEDFLSGYPRVQDAHNSPVFHLASALKHLRIKIKERNDNKD